jgi:anaerobic magnesium-protoporphyrin IX monomethyl ester cyclase
MKVTLISPHDLSAWDFGIRSLSAVLKKEGHSVRLIFMPLHAGQRTINSDTLKQTIDLSADSGLIGLSVMTSFFSGMAVVTGMLKDNLNIPILWGGIHPTLRPDECLKHADMVCVGEGEETLIDVVNNLERGGDFRNVLGLGYRDHDRVIINDPRPLIIDLNLLPLPEYECEDDWLLQDGCVRKIDKTLLESMLTLYTHTSKESYKIYHTITSRGCSFACAYCCNSYFRKIHSRQEIIRKRSVENIINELTNARQVMPFVNCILINDDDFFCRDANEIAVFAKEYKEKIKLPLWITGVSISTFDAEKFALLVDAGLKFVRSGIQSGSNRTKKMYHRYYSNQRIIAVAREINKFRHTIAPPSYDIILDNPWESENDLTETLMLLSSLPRPYGIELFSLTFYPGTELYDKAKKEGIIKNDIIEIYDRSYYAIKPTYLNKLFQLHSACLSKGSAGISPAVMFMLTNPLLRRLRISFILYRLLKIIS